MNGAATIRYVKGDATQPVGTGTRVIAHVANTEGGWGRGFVLALSARNRSPEYSYCSWAKACGGKLPLGEVQLVPFADDVWVANMIAQQGYRSADNPVPLHHEALEQCLASVREWAQDRTMAAPVHMPRIGCGEGGATWPAIEPIVLRALSGCEVVVYDLEAGNG